MLNENFIAKSETYTWMLNSLIASYGRYANANGIDLKNEESDFTKLYYDIIAEQKKSRFYKTEEELTKCKEFIDMAKDNLERIGGKYI